MKSQPAHKMFKDASKRSSGPFSTLNLKSQGKFQPVFKSIWDAEGSEKASTKPSQDFSDNSCKPQSSSSKILHKTISAKDKEYNNNTNIITNTTHSPMLGNMDINGTTNTRSLHPREHVDKLSEYISIHIMICNADYYMCHSEIMFCVFFSYLCELIAKQRIDSGFFLFQAEMKRKKEKKQSKKIKAAKCRNLKDFMDSSDEDFC